MGKCIECKIGDKYEMVWNYGFGSPNSMHRVNTELGIGEYHLVRYIYKEDDADIDYEYVSADRADGDILILSRIDIEKMEVQLQLLKTSITANENWLFIAMVEDIRAFIIEHSAQDRFIFECDF